jgi:crossover junction endodeoxyribonuclease RusA
MTPDIPIEFVVKGTVISLQGSTHAKQAWKEAIRAAGLAVLPPEAWLLTDRVAVTIYYFPEGQMQGDVDNIVKPILDAMCRLIYVDDQQIERLVVQKFEPENIYAFSDPTPVLVSALALGGSAIYIRVTDDPHEDLQ